MLTRWYSSSWRDGEWIEMEWPSKIPYRKLVNAVGRQAVPPTLRVNALGEAAVPFHSPLHWFPGPCREV